MKRMIISLIAISLFAGCFGVVAASGDAGKTGASHLLWDIPFLISPQECLDLMTERAGNHFLIDGSIGYPQVLTREDSQIEVFGHPAKLWTLFAGPDYQLAGIVLTYMEYAVPTDNLHTDELKADARTCLERFEELRMELTEAYGPSTYSCVGFPPNKEETEIGIPHVVPSNNNGIDYEEIVNLTADAQVEFQLMIYWENVKLRFYSSPRHGDGHYLSTDVFYDRDDIDRAHEEPVEYYRPNYD